MTDLSLVVDFVDSSTGIRKERFERHYLSKFDKGDGERALFLFGATPENLDQILLWGQSAKVRVLFARLPQEDVARLQEKVKWYDQQHTGMDSTVRIFLREFKPLVKLFLEKYTLVKLGEMVIGAKHAQGIPVVA